MKMKCLMTASLIAALALCAHISGCTTPQPQPAKEGADLPYLNKSFDLDVRWGASPKTVMMRLFQRDIYSFERILKVVLRFF